MRVCLICEGSYPYVAGGVAGWVQMLCQSLSDTEFVIWSIATTKEEMSAYQYELPSNIKEVRTIYLGEKKFERKEKKCRLSQEEAEILKGLTADTGEKTDWKKTLEFMKRYRHQLVDILLSEYFYAICLKKYSLSDQTEPFLDFLWNFRGMYFPFMNILSSDIPQADVYHALSTGYAGILGSLSSYVEHKPFLLSEHGIYTREREEDIIRSDWVKGGFKELWIAFFKKLSAIAYQQASVVTSLFTVNKSLQVELGCPKEKIRIIPNGVDRKEFLALEAKQEKREGEIRLGAILRMVPIKDVKTMLLAFAYVQEEIPDSQLVILGGCEEDPAYYEECLEMLHSLGIPHVTFCGRVSVKDYLADLDLLLLSSISEGQPLAVLEGMAAGIPFVCTNVGDCRDLLEGKEGDSFGKAGLIVPVMDSKAMAEGILYLLRHPKLRQTMGEVGRKRVETYYQKENFLQQYRQLYQSLKEEMYGGNRI